MMENEIPQVYSSDIGPRIWFEKGEVFRIVDLKKYILTERAAYLKLMKQLDNIEKFLKS